MISICEREEEVLAGIRIGGHADRKKEHPQSDIDTDSDEVESIHIRPDEVIVSTKQVTELSLVKFRRFEQDRSKRTSIDSGTGYIGEGSASHHRIHSKMINKLIDEGVSFGFRGRFYIEAGDMELIERYDRLDDVLHIERRLIPMGDQRLGDDQNIVEEEEVSILSGLLVSFMPFKQGVAAYMSVNHLQHLS